MGKIEVIETLAAYMKANRLKNRTVEKALYMPKNSLSNFLKLYKPLPDKWVEPIEKFCGAKKDVITLAEVVDDYKKRGLQKLFNAPLKILSTPADAYDGQKVDWSIGDEVGQYEMITYESTPAWVNEIEDFCLDKNITPQELIACYKKHNGGKDTRPDTKTYESHNTKTYDPNTNPLYLKKMKLK